MKSLFQFLRWPVLCGVLAAIIILDHFPQLFADLPVSFFGLSGEETKTENHNNNNNNPYSYADAIVKAAPAVVNIYTSKTERQQVPESLNNFLRKLQKNNTRLKIQVKERIQRSLGSGVIISHEGYILTNFHVIEDKDEILVRLQDEREALAVVIGTHPESDLAVLKIDLDNLNTIPIGNPSEARIGDVVLAIGNAYGFGHTVTQGIISATGRYGLQLNEYENYIQTDAAINPGNSGGALIDARGNLLGINTLNITKDGGSQGIGLAIPSDLALGILSDLVMFGKVTHGWLGVNVNPLLPTVAIENNLPQNNGIVITDTVPAGPADQSGLMEGDIITRINDRPVGDGRAAMNFIINSRPGEKVAIDVFRDGQELQIEAVLGSEPQTSDWLDEKG